MTGGGDDEKKPIISAESKSHLHANIFNPDPSQASPAADWFEKQNLIWSLEKTTEDEKRLGIFKALPQNLFVQVRNRVEGDIGKKIANATSAELKTAMISLFDRRESAFAKRYAALQLEWKGDNSEPTSTFFARLRREIANFDLSTFKEDQLGTLLLLIAMRAPHLDRVRTLVLTKLREKPTMKLSDCEDLILDHLATAMEQKLPETPSVNLVSQFNAKKGSKGVQVNGCAEGDDKSACIHCGRYHESQLCRFKDAECHGCGKKGHIRSVCSHATKWGAPKFRQHQVQAADSCQTIWLQQLHFNEVKITAEAQENKDHLAAIEAEGKRLEVGTVHALEVQAAERDTQVEAGRTQKDKPLGAHESGERKVDRDSSTSEAFLRSLEAMGAASEEVSVGKVPIEGDNVANNFEKPFVNLSQKFNVCEREEVDGSEKFVEPVNTENHRGSAVCEFQVQSSDDIHSQDDSYRHDGHEEVESTCLVMCPEEDDEKCKQHVDRDLSRVLSTAISLHYESKSIEKIKAPVSSNVNPLHSPSSRFNVVQDTQPSETVTENKKATYPEARNTEPEGDPPDATPVKTMRM